MAGLYTFRYCSLGSARPFSPDRCVHSSSSDRSIPLTGLCSVLLAHSARLPTARRALLAPSDRIVVLIRLGSLGSVLLEWLCSLILLGSVRTSQYFSLYSARYGSVSTARWALLALSARIGPYRSVPSRFALLGTARPFSPDRWASYGTARSFGSDRSIPLGTWVWLGQYCSPHPFSSDRWAPYRSVLLAGCALLCSLVQLGSVHTAWYCSLVVLGKCIHFNAIWWGIGRDDSPAVGCWCPSLVKPAPFRGIIALSQFSTVSLEVNCYGWRSGSAIHSQQTVGITVQRTGRYITNMMVRCPVCKISHPILLRFANGKVRQQGAVESVRVKANTQRNGAAVAKIGRLQMSAAHLSLPFLHRFANGKVRRQGAVEPALVTEDHPQNGAAVAKIERLQLSAAHLSSPFLHRFANGKLRQQGAVESVRVETNRLQNGAAVARIGGQQLSAAHLSSAFLHRFANGKVRRRGTFDPVRVKANRLRNGAAVAKIGGLQFNTDHLSSPFLLRFANGQLRRGASVMRSPSHPWLARNGAVLVEYSAQLYLAMYSARRVLARFYSSSTVDWHRLLCTVLDEFSFVSLRHALSEPHMAFAKRWRIERDTCPVVYSVVYSMIQRLTCESRLHAKGLRIGLVLQLKGHANVTQRAQNHNIWYSIHQDIRLAMSTPPNYEIVT
ncbi:hypothetical protein FA15DRAFT_662156 [Coprinopsis marcescibilis]|uniref:Uncharacterized protein n=1 Tax=Coprinopsis marcescibilis TaxID=230819 RepID=A0A5C3K9D1_COPMA|nr:hypothetical protein FA15DRAFT_662156 [Coprinopsis marcescibilis]